MGSPPEIGRMILEMIAQDLAKSSRELFDKGLLNEKELAHGNATIATAVGLARLSEKMTDKTTLQAFLLNLGTAIIISPETAEAMVEAFQHTMMTHKDKLTEKLNLGSGSCDDCPVKTECNERGGDKEDCAGEC